MKLRDKSDYMIFVLSLSSVFANVLGIISGLLIARCLLPEDLGFFNGFSVLTSYIILAQLGVSSGLSRELPLFLGRGDQVKCNKYASVAHFWFILLGAGAFLLALLIALICIAKGSYRYSAGMFALGLLSFQAFYVNYYLKIIYRTHRKFDKISIINVIIALISFLSVYFVFKYGFYGLCIRVFIIVLVDFSLSLLWNPVRVAPSWDKESFSELLKVGLPMFGVANVYSMWPVVQKTLILWMGGAKFLGLFALAVVVENAMKTITSSISVVVYPSMVAEWGKGASVGMLLKQVVRPVFYTAGLFLFLVPLGWYLLPVVVDKLLPKYSSGTYAAQWMLLVGFVGVFGIISNIYNVLHKQIDRLISYASGMFFWLVSLCLLYLYYGEKLEIFPMAMFPGFVAMIAVNIYHIYKYNRLDTQVLNK